MRWLLLLLAMSFLFALVGCSNNYAGCKIYYGSPQPDSPVYVDDSSYTLYSPATATNTHTLGPWTADPTISKAPSGALTLPGFGQNPPTATSNVPAIPAPPDAKYIPPPPKTTEEGYQINHPPQQGGL